MGVRSSEWIDFIPDPRPKHDFRYALNIEKIKKLGFNVKKNPVEQFRETIDWYKQNRSWWEKRKEEAESIYSA
jgi:dTDP-glucose 4,6-dehydratase